MIETIRQGLKEDGFEVSTSKLCRWFDVPRRTVQIPPGEVRAEDPGAVSSSHRGDDRGQTVFRLPDGGASVGLQQEHGAENLPA